VVPLVSERKGERTGRGGFLTQRALRTALRAAHLLAFACLYGGHVYGVAPDRLVPALVATIVTGGALLAVDALGEPVSLTQVRGLASFVKIALVGMTYWTWDQRVAVLTLVALIGAVSSHMPSRYRYYSPLRGRTVGSMEKG
jgi:hypothetical protein